MEYLLIVLAVGWLIYKFCRIPPKLQPEYSPSMTFDDVIMRGQLYKNLNRHMETVGEIAPERSGHDLPLG